MKTYRVTDEAGAQVHGKKIKKGDTFTVQDRDGVAECLLRFRQVELVASAPAAETQPAAQAAGRADNQKGKK